MGLMKLCILRFDPPGLCGCARCRSDWWRPRDWLHGVDRHQVFQVSDFASSCHYFLLTFYQLSPVSTVSTCLQHVLQPYFNLLYPYSSCNHPAYPHLRGGCMLLGLAVAGALDHLLGRGHILELGCLAGPDVHRTLKGYSNVSNGR